MENQKENTARLFGINLDNDNFPAAKKLLTENCVYEIGDKLLHGNGTIIDSYEKNMKEGQQKFDELVWGKSKIKLISENQFEVYFSDFLKLKGLSHNYRCKQLLQINDQNLIEKITHIELPGEREKLNAYYRKVGLL